MISLDERNRKNMQRLSEDIMIEVLLFVPDRDLGSLSLSCTKIRKTIEDRRHFERRVFLSLKQKDSIAKTLYFNLCVTRKQTIQLARYKEINDRYRERNIRNREIIIGALQQLHPHIG